MTVASNQSRTRLKVVQASKIDAKEHRVYSAAKRILDVGFSLPIVIFVLPPLMIVVAIVHRLVSPGPLFFRQQRCGRAGELFSIVKFRTMTPVAPEQSNDGDLSRIFRFGDLLRLTKVDEIPQFINVLRGEMSIVGPRPHHLDDCRTFEQRVAGYRERQAVKPGITGLAQVREYAGRFEWDCTESRVDADLEYIHKRSLAVDLMLILRTIQAIAVRCAQKAFKSTSATPEESMVPFPGEVVASQKVEVAESSPRRAA